MHWTRTSKCLLLVTLSCGSAIAHWSAGAEEAWKAGWAKVNITPEKNMWMAGYGGRDRPSEGKLTDLWAKVLVLEAPAGGQAVLITLDLVGIDRLLSQRLCAELGRRHNWQREQIAICTSHTHTGPVVGRNLGAMHYALVDNEQRALIDEYERTLEQKVLDAVQQASQKLVSCRVEIGVGKTTFAVNRRNNREPEVPQLRQQGRLVGPVDHDVPVLAVRDGEDQLRVVVFGYACHATVLSFYQFSGDYPGFAQIELERLYPHCQAMFWAGCGADQNPLPRRTVELAQEYGRRLAGAVADVLAAPMEPLAGWLECRYVEVPLPFARGPDRSELENQSRSGDKFVAARARLWLERLDNGQTVPADYPYPISVWRVGEQWEWYFLGGEVVVDYALRIKAERRGTRTWVAGYSHDVMAYIPSRRVLSEGGYEGGGAMVYYGLLSPWSETCEDQIVSAVHALGGQANRNAKYMLPAAKDTPTQQEVTMVP